MNPSNQLILDEIAQGIIDVSRDFRSPSKRYEYVRNMLEHVFTLGALEQSDIDAEKHRRENAIDIQVLAGADSRQIPRN